MIEHRNFPKLNIQTSLLGFGCMRFPTIMVDGENIIDEEQAQKMLDIAYQAGVNYFDTAYPYHGGKSEIFVGKVLDNYPRESYFLATKLPIWELQKAEDIYQIFNEQLEKLNKTYVDFYLLHAMNHNYFEKVKQLNVIEKLKELKKQGKIKYIGFSFHDDYEVFNEIINYFDWDFCQIQFNYMDTEIQAGLKGLKLAESKNIPIIVMEPIKGGSLASLPLDVTTKFRQKHQDWTDASWALRFVSSFENVKVILSGMSSIEQVKDNLNTFKNIKPLDKEDMQIIKEVKEIITKRVKNGCTACRYCMPCPAGVDIPSNFAIWNDFSKYNNKVDTIRRINNLKNKNAFASVCVKCGKCEKLCPQKLSIRHDLERVVIELDHLG